MLTSSPPSPNTYLAYLAHPHTLSTSRSQCLDNPMLNLYCPYIHGYGTIQWSMIVLLEATPLKKTPPAFINCH